ncbi:tetratricopeptide repeat domain protein [Penicillium verhagenii]|uniref:tetratricopeptide repeat domain protein n=1 Tax=Penicillium verhagenii TaxID=1562060 RepID=UPI0025457982|nr:tetratricopeptide repeat domain protein [Penicillium verhagenii]KAJ5935001.1 tetratricopeptide repeat domain protein [Penicillium verhagenii]
MRSIRELAWKFMEGGVKKRELNEDDTLSTNTAGELWNEALGFFRAHHEPDSDLMVQIEANLEHLYTVKLPDWGAGINIL